MGTGLPEGKAAEAWRLPPTPSSAEVKERVQLYLSSPLWAFVASSRVNFTFTFTSWKPAWCTTTKWPTCYNLTMPTYCLPPIYVMYLILTWRHAVAQFVETLRYKSEGRGFDSRWCHWNFSLTQSFRLHNGPGVDSASNRNEYQEYFLGVKAAGE